MQVTFKGQDLYWLIFFYVLATPCMFYCGAKAGTWIGNRIIAFVRKKTERPSQLSLFTFVLALLVQAPVAFAEKRNSPKEFQEGAKVRVAGCKTRNGQDWVSTGYPNAELRPIKGCGKKGVVKSVGRACAPDYLNIDSCDPWSYHVEIDGEEFRYYAYQLGKGKTVRNRMVDFICDKGKKKCSVE